MEKKHSRTQLIHAGRRKAYTLGGVNPVVQRASSIVFDTLAEKKHAIANRHQQTLFYGRRGTTTHFALQDAMTELEQGTGCALFPCGAAAIANSILAFVKAGDHILVSGSAYEPTQDFCQKILADMQVTTEYFDPLEGAEIGQRITSNTRVVFLESPGSYTMEVHDTPAIVQAVRERAPDAIIMMDNTWAAGRLYQPLTQGVDISIQSGTKYIIGHSDNMLGTAVANARCWPTLRERAYLMGQTVDPDTAYQAARGLRTLDVRLAQHQDNALQVANWLNEQTEVASVLHPAFADCPGHRYFARDFTGSNGLFSFVFDQRLSDAQLDAFCDHLQHFSMAYSWGGFESLLLANQPEQLNRIRPVGKVDFSGTLVRLHIGLEDVDDLIADLAAGFARINNV
ncbi:cystathionine beta-lyase [Salinivibrio siamensis]|uniref:Cystathionine beta-lyase n=1 Tax=Salinivibrio siamensis TaxID=414286 RepID=A0ABX3K5T2_9GAMM|nr:MULTISPECIES: cystathionine beta-lyase [Salinivibrio]OOE65028.1 cystathionine beta-lyase [Salinivibrio sp. IB868]OOE75052.1 cystathionine beta-lyase [Salinivibrio sp. IB870]OOE81178.1 cystathionine beta-lyase [Salinivibrio siamensis]